MLIDYNGRRSDFIEILSVCDLVVIITNVDNRKCFINCKLLRSSCACCIIDIVVILSKEHKKFRKIQDFTKNSTANIIAHFGQYVK